MWHGGGLTGVTYETTPDGREGWLNYFIKKGWAVYNSDAVERGRAGWAMYPDVFKGEPVFLTKENPFDRFRIGAGTGASNKDPAKMKVLPGSQFPLEGYDNFTKQNVPRWTTTDDAIIAAYTALVEKSVPASCSFIRRPASSDRKWRRRVRTKSEHSSWSSRPGWAIPIRCATREHADPHAVWRFHRAGLALARHTHKSNQDAGTGSRCGRQVRSREPAANRH